jgi:hypothetical protein
MLNRFVRAHERMFLKIGKPTALPVTSSSS